jgi:hypothetical protein
MSWSNKTKIPQGGKDEEIQTPTGEQILLGPTETDVYLYVAGYTNWDLKNKTAIGDWSLKTKVTP